MRDYTERNAVKMGFLSCALCDPSTALPIGQFRCGSIRIHFSGASLTATSDGADKGATFNIRLPIPAQHPQARDADNE